MTTKKKPQLKPHQLQGFFYALNYILFIALFVIIVLLALAVDELKTQGSNNRQYYYSIKSKLEYVIEDTHDIQWNTKATNWGIEKLTQKKKECK